MGAKLAERLDAFAGELRRRQLLRPRGSNPDFLVQSEACCHYTRPQRRSLRIRDSAEGSSLGDHLPRLRQFLGAADAEAAGDAVALQVPDRELATLAVAAPELAVPLVGGADVLDAGPVGEVAEEVGHDLVIGVGAKHVAGDVDSLLHRHVPVLDVDATAV